jgi:hypothetical protein
MNEAVARVRGLVRQNPSPSGIDWRDIENRLGVALPLDYKEWCDEIPSGRFDNGYVDIVHPGHAKNSRDFVRYQLNYCQSMEEWRKGEAGRVPDGPAGKVRVYPSIPGLFPWGGIGYDWIFAWQIVGPPDTWGSFLLTKEFDYVTSLEGSMAEAASRIIFGESGISDLDYLIEEPRDFHAS